MHLTLRHATTAALAAALTMSAAACSGGTAKTSSHPKVGFVVANSKLNFASEMMDGFRTGVSQVGGVDSVEVGPPTVDGPLQLRMFEDLETKTKDGIAVFTLAPELFSPKLAAAAGKGLPLIAVDNRPDPTSGIKLFVGNDNYELGTMLADEAVKLLPAGAEGDVVIGSTTPGVPVLDSRAKGMRDELHKKLPKVRVLGPFDTKQDVLANRSAWAALVRSNPAALAFLGTGDADGWNLADIKKRTHGKWVAGAFDLDPRSLKAVKDGRLLLVSPEHFVKGAIAGRLQAQHARTGKPLPKGWIYTPGLAVTKANVDEIIARQASLTAKQAWFKPRVDAILANPGTYLKPLQSAR